MYTNGSMSVRVFQLREIINYWPIIIIDRSTDNVTRRAYTSKLKAFSSDHIGKVLQQEKTSPAERAQHHSSVHMYIRCTCNVTY